MPITDVGFGISQVQIVFVSPPPAAGQGAVIEQARITGLGDIENWPAGFLAESPSEAGAILRASAGLAGM